MPRGAPGVPRPAQAAAMRRHWADPEVRARRRARADQRRVRRRHEERIVHLRAQGTDEEYIASLEASFAAEERGRTR